MYCVKYINVFIMYYYVTAACQKILSKEASKISSTPLSHEACFSLKMLILLEN